MLLAGAVLVNDSDDLKLIGQLQLICESRHDQTRMKVTVDGPHAVIYMEDGDKIFMSTLVNVTYSYDDNSLHLISFKDGYLDVAVREGIFKTGIALYMRQTAYDCFHDYSPHQIKDPVPLPSPRIEQAEPGATQ
jgi:hypothetical protein